MRPAKLTPMAAQVGGLGARQQSGPIKSSGPSRSCNANCQLLSPRLFAIYDMYTELVYTVELGRHSKSASEAL